MNSIKKLDEKRTTNFLFQGMSTKKSKHFFNLFFSCAPFPGWSLNFHASMSFQNTVFLRDDIAR